MYGYVRPLRDELKIREYERFRGVYCGLCHTLRRRYGPLARFAVSYDLTFLAMLLAAGGEGESMCEKRCPYHPARRTACPEMYPGMEAAADYSVILARGKLADAVSDGGFLKALGSRLLLLFLRPAYKKAAANRPDFARTTQEQLEALSVLEQSNTADLDAVADTFAQILEAAVPVAAGEDRRRILRELLYHLGRIVYILDAVDDLKRDERTGAYNPLRYRFSPVNGSLSRDEEDSLRLILTHSHDRVCAAYVLLEGNTWKGILDNIIYYGLPAAAQSVFSGEWRSYRHKIRGRNRL